MRTNLSKKLRDMHALTADTCDPEFNRALIEAAEDIERRAQDRGDCQIVMDAQEAEIERLRAVIAAAGHYVALCPVPSEAFGDLRIELLEQRQQIAMAAAAHQQGADESRPGSV